MIDLITRLIRRVSVTTSQHLKNNFPGDVNIEAIYNKNPHIRNYIFPSYPQNRCWKNIGTYILLTKREGRIGRISARGLDSTDRAQRGPYKKDRGPIFSQYGPEQAWLIRDLLHD